MGDRARLLEIFYVDDQRVEARSSLGFIDARDGLAIGRVGRQAVDGFGRDGDGPAFGDQPRRFRDRFGSIRQDAGVLRAHAAAL